MIGYVIDILPDRGAHPEDPAVLVTLQAPKGRGRRGPPLHPREWPGGDGLPFADVVAWVSRSGNHPSRVTQHGSALRFPLRGLDYLPDSIHAALGLPEASSMPIELVLTQRAPGHHVASLEYLDTRFGDLVFDGGLHREGGEWRYFPPGLVSLLSGLGAPTDGVHPDLAEISRRAAAFLPVEGWDRLVRDRRLRIRPASACAIMAVHDRASGYGLAMAPVDPKDPDRLLLEDDRHGHFGSGIRESAGQAVPRCLMVQGMAVYMTEALADCATWVRKFNRFDVGVRGRNAGRIDVILADLGAGRAYRRIASFGERASIYGEPDVDEMRDILAFLRTVRDPDQGFDTKLRLREADLITRAEASGYAADWGTSVDVFVAQAGEGADPCRADGQPGDGEDACAQGIGDDGTEATGEEAGFAAPGEGGPVPAEGAGVGDAAAATAFGPGARMYAAENLGTTLNLVEGRIVRPDPGILTREAMEAELAPADASGRMREHQFRIPAWVWDHWRGGAAGALLCDEPGTGKTFGLLLAAICLRRVIDEPMLFVVEDQTLDHWNDELTLRFRGSETFMRAYGMDFRRRDPLVQLMQMRRSAFVLTTWSGLVHHQDLFKQARFGLVICDEAGNAKNPIAARRQTVRALTASLTILVTGTPIENGLADLWSLVDLARPGHLGPWASFKAEFVVPPPERRPIQALVRRLCHGDVPTILRRTKDEVGLSLPAKRIHPVLLDMAGPQAEAYLDAYRTGGERNTMRRDVRRISIHHDMRAMTDPDALARLTARRAAEWCEESAVLSFCLGKLEAVRERKGKALIFTTEVEMAQRPVANGLGFALGLSRALTMVNGREQAATRGERIRAFKRSTGFDVIMLTNRLCARGLTLTEADTVILLSRWYNPAVESQSIDRVHRLGLSHDVDVFVPMARHPAIGDLSHDLILDRMHCRKSGDAAGFLSPQWIQAVDVEREMSAAVEAIRLRAAA